MVFAVLASNRDDHTQQHSYLMDETGAWRLAPACDLTYSAGPGGEHYLDVEGEGRNPTREQVRGLGRRHGLADGLIDTIIDEVRAALASWASFADEADVTKASRAEIAATHADVAAHVSALTIDGLDACDAFIDFAQWASGGRRRGRPMIRGPSTRAADDQVRHVGSPGPHASCSWNGWRRRR